MRRSMSWCLPAMLLSSPAFAVPAQLGWQGRMLDGAGQPVAGALDVTFRLLNAPTGGDTVWQETQSVSFQQGYYAIVLGADEAGNPLEDAALEQWPLFLEVQVAGRPPMFPRSELSSVPFARLAGTATHLQGGTVDAASVSVGGQPVIDSAGQWVGPTPPVDFADVAGVPADVADGDDDALSNLSCADRQLPVWDASSARWLCGIDQDAFAGFDCAPGQILKTGAAGTWACGHDADTPVTESEVDAFVANNGFVHADQLARVALTGSYADLSSIPQDLMDGDADTLAGLSCLDGQTAVWAAPSGTWMCGVSPDTFAGFSCEVGQILKASATGGWGCGTDADTPTTEAEVDAFVENNGYIRFSEVSIAALSGDYRDLSNLPTIQTALDELGCEPGAILTRDEMAWSCHADPGTLISTACSWVEPHAATVGSCEPPPCPAGWENLGVTENQKVGILYAENNLDESEATSRPTQFQGVGVSRRSCWSPVRQLVLPVRCAWSGSTAATVGACDPSTCPDGWRDTNTVSHIIEAAATSLSVGRTVASGSESAGYTERICLR